MLEYFSFFHFESEERKSSSTLWISFINCNGAIYCLFEGLSICLAKAKQRKRKNALMTLRKNLFINVEKTSFQTCFTNQCCAMMPFTVSWNWKPVFSVLCVKNCFTAFTNTSKCWRNGNTVCHWFILIPDKFLLTECKLSSFCSLLPCTTSD